MGSHSARFEPRFTGATAAHSAAPLSSVTLVRETASPPFRLVVFLTFETAPNENSGSRMSGGQDCETNGSEPDSTRLSDSGKKLVRIMIRSREIFNGFFLRCV